MSADRAVPIVIKYNGGPPIDQAMLTNMFAMIGLADFFKVYSLTVRHVG